MILLGYATLVLATSHNDRASEVPHSQRRHSHSHVKPGRNLSGGFNVRVLLRSDALAGCCIAFLPVDGVDDRPKLCSLFGQCVPFVNGSFVPSLRSLVGRFPPDLETLDK